MNTEQKENCWICLGNESEPPPNSHSSKPQKLIKVCGCSIRVHMSCLVDWSKSVDLNSRLEGRPQDCLFEQKALFYQTVDGDGHPIITFFTPRRDSKVLPFASELVRCPQCKKKIVFKFKPTEILSISHLVRYAAVSVLSYSPRATLSLAIGAISAVGVSFLTKCGYSLWSLIAGDKLLGGMLVNKGPGLPIFAERFDGLSIPNIGLVAGFPVLLFNARSDSVWGYLLNQAWSLLLCSKGLNTARTMTMFFQLGTMIYRALKSATINRIYFRWLASSNSSAFLSDHVSEPDSMKIPVQYHSAQSRAWHVEKIRRRAPPLPWFQRLKRRLSPENLLVGGYADLDGFNESESRYIWKTDFSSAFHKSNFIWKCLTTVIWPIAGSLVGHLITRFTPFSSSVIPYLTPDETQYLTNLIGMGIVSLVKDLTLLYMTYIDVSKYNDVEIMGAPYPELDLFSITTVATRFPVSSMIRSRSKFLGVDSRDPTGERQYRIAKEQDFGPVTFGVESWECMPTLNQFTERLWTLLVYGKQRLFENTVRDVKADEKNKSFDLYIYDAN